MTPLTPGPPSPPLTSSTAPTTTSGVKGSASHHKGEEGATPFSNRKVDDRKKGGDVGSRDAERVKEDGKKKGLSFVNFLNT